MNREALEQLVAQKLSEKQTVPTESFDRAKLEELVLQKMSEQGVTEINKEDEADLGFVNRARYAIEPIQSNRKALLEQQFGRENVLDQNGELYIKQDNQFLPVNKDGFSVADVADVAGATPEMVGGAAGAGIGMVAGIPTGGTASVPMAAAIGATGAGLGSIARQGLSAAIGNPQVATAGERAIETGISAGLGGVASGASAYLKPVVQKAKTGITQFIKNLSGEGAESIGESSTKTIAKTRMGLGGELKPVERTADDIYGEIADQSGREMVQENQKQLSEIAAREGLPQPSYAQAAQGKAILAENKVMDMPLVGGKIRKQADTQAKLVRNNLEKITGRKIDFDNDVDQVGQTAKEFAETAIFTRKKISQELYDQVEKEGKNAAISKYEFLHRFKNQAQEMGLIDENGGRAVYNGASGMTEETFNKLQKVVFQGIDASKQTSGKMPFQTANGIVKTLKANADELKASNPDAHRRISGFIKELNGTLEKVLDREAPKLSEKFRAANLNWRAYKHQDKIYQGLIGDTSPEHVVKRIMQSSKNIDGLKELIGEDRVKEIGKSYVAEILYNLNKSGVARADSAKAALRKNATQIRATLGSEAYDKLIDNLTYLNSTGRPLTISRETMYNLFDNRGPGLKGYVMSLKGAADTIAESKGTTLTKAARDTVAGAATGTIKKTGGVASKLSGNQKASGFANLAGDRSQRKLADIPAQYTKIAEKEDESKQRQRAISGRRAKDNK